MDPSPDPMNSTPEKGVGAQAATGADLAGILKGRSLVIASNRGPVSFKETDRGEMIAERGAGGLVTALTGVMRHASGLWMASAMTAGDRKIVREKGSEHVEAPFDGANLRLRYLTFDRLTFDRYYNRISNSVFWFLNHSMWNLPVEPSFGRNTRESWLCYQEVNERFAQALAEEVTASRTSAPVMLHDYHLMLVAAYLRKLVPDVFSYHFTHSPWTQPDMMRVLPGTMAEKTLQGMLANDLLGFQTRRWSRNFMWCCAEILGADVNFEKGIVTYEGAETVVRDYPISIDMPAVRKLANSRKAATHLAWLDRTLDGRKLILRVDRMELSKNIVRGFRAYEEMLRTHPEWQGKVVHVALLYPSRRALSDYRNYEAEVLDVHDRINEELGTDDWQPIIILDQDDYLRALAFGRRYDVLMVNPITDGMNLVAKEGPAVNEKSGVLVLSRNAGAWHELGRGAVGVNPYDVHEMAEALYEGLTMKEDRREEKLAFLKEVVRNSTPSKWVRRQLNDIQRLHDG